MASLSHPALIYDSPEAFLEVTVPFVRGGLEAGEQVLAVTSRRNIDLLGEALDGAADAVDFSEAEDWLTTPWRALHAYRRYVEQHANGGRVRVIGEPFVPARTTPAVREWTRYESMINVAFADLPLSILCPYDASVLPPSIVEHALCTHPEVLAPGGLGPSERFVETAAFSAELDRLELEPPVPPVAERPLKGDLGQVRRFAAAEAGRAGVSPARIDDLVLAVHEVATNVRRHGAGPGVLRSWVAEGEFVCELTDCGPGMSDPLAGYIEPADGQTTGRGLWLARRLTDLVQVRTGADGTVVRLHIALGA